MSTQNSQVNVLARVLDGASLRQRVIANNIANVNTPLYQRMAVVFEEQLSTAVHSSDPRALQKVRPEIVEVPGPVVRADGNTVSLEQEMLELNKNSLLFSAAAQVLTNRLALLRAAITGR